MQNKRILARMTPDFFRNEILTALAPVVIQRLHLKRLDLPRDFEIESPGELIRYLIFIDNGIASLSTFFEGGSQIDVGMFGSESVIGSSALNGSPRSFNKIYMQMAGRGHSCSLDMAQSEFSLSERFHEA
jgi:hypothetical protein